MDDHTSPALAQSSAVRAFEELRCEVSLLRRAIEGLTAERRDQPDYGPTLEALATSNEQIRAWARNISERPALQLTPQRIAEEIEAATSQWRHQEGQALAAARGSLATAAQELKATSLGAREAQEQVRREKLIGGTCFLAGFLLAPLLAQVTMVWR